MMNIEPIRGKNLSDAWALTFIKCWNAPHGTIAPAIISFDVKEDDKAWRLEKQTIRKLLENQLTAFGIVSANQSNVETVAGTIFPESIWKRCNGDSDQLFRQYDKMWPFVSKCRQNRHGTYFRRLTSFGENGINQLRKIIDTWHADTHRRSALQAGVFNPAIDHSMARQLGFPCLQQVVFHPEGTNGSEGMIVVAFYANQLLLEKAYGNYLGLYRLGKFMAGKMGLHLKGVTCIASNLSLSKQSKRECQYLLSEIKRVLSDAD
jgi:thymidylate synthase